MAHAGTGSSKAMRQLAPEVNLSDMPELLPGARPSANPAKREEFERRCLQLYRDAECEEKEAAKNTQAAAGSSAKGSDLEAMFPLLDSSLVRSIMADSPTPQHALETLLALSEAVSEPVVGGEPPPRAATPPPRMVGVEDHEKFPSLVDRDGWQIASSRDFVRDKEELGSAWRDRAKDIADIPAPAKAPTVASTAAAGAWGRRRRPEKGEPEASNVTRDDEMAPLETEYEFRQRVGQRKAKTRALYGRGGRGRGAGVSGRGCSGDVDADDVASGDEGEDGPTEEY
eukprot:TRINITY_DN59036_c0_g1_i1.p1 TRINITY_DN59036_c0_g1~~TRINITY_DN59036_c0_g1_i1.p1  ORF type:complete len:303 (-),score=64.19 TRINITY_DN59036_c0_g1_i1:104-958(-)